MNLLRSKDKSMERIVKKLYYKIVFMLNQTQHRRATLSICFLSSHEINDLGLHWCPDHQGVHIVHSYWIYTYVLKGSMCCTWKKYWYFLQCKNMNDTLHGKLQNYILYSIFFFWFSLSVFKNPCNKTQSTWEEYIYIKSNYLIFTWFRGKNVPCCNHKPHFFISLKTTYEIYLLEEQNTD